MPSLQNRGVNQGRTDEIILDKSMVDHRRLITIMSATELRRVVHHHHREIIEGDIIVIVMGEDLTVMSLLV